MDGDVVNANPQTDGDDYCKLACGFPSGYRTLWRELNRCCYLLSWFWDLVDLEKTS